VTAAGGSLMNGLAGSGARLLTYNVVVGLISAGETMLDSCADSGRWSNSPRRTKSDFLRIGMGVFMQFGCKGTIFPLEKQMWSFIFCLIGRIWNAVAALMV
jgi:hypothetical protein